jgi:hypothetical protein
MMKKLKLLLLVTLFVSLLMSESSLCKSWRSVRSCPEDFELHHFMDHSGNICTGTSGIRDGNGDGYICMQMVTSTLHLHVDNICHCLKLHHQANTNILEP